MIVDERFASFLTGRATGEQIRLLRARGASKRFLCDQFMVGEKRLKQCERTPGDSITIQPMTLIASPALYLPKGSYFCIRRFSRKRLIKPIFLGTWNYHKTTPLDVALGQAATLRWWLNGEIHNMTDLTELQKKAASRRTKDWIGWQIRHYQFPPALKDQPFAEDLFSDLAEEHTRMLFKRMGVD